MTKTSPLNLLSLPRRAVKFVWFVARFIKALIASNVEMARVVLFRPVRELAPDFISYPIAGLSRTEIVLLSHCITLTPGTTSVEISEDNTTLLVHALDGGNPAAVRRAIKQDLEEPLLAWTR